MSWTIKAEENNELKMGVEVEKEHADAIKWLAKKLGPGPGYDEKTLDGIVTEMAKKIAEAHLKEVPDYYTRLKDMEVGAKRHDSTQTFHRNLKKALGQE